MSEQADGNVTRAALENERHELEVQLADLGTAEIGEDYDENFADSGQVAAEQGEAKSLAGSLRDQLNDVQHALDKLDSGTYGTCEVCGQPIGDTRLEAMPATRFCIEHA